MAADLKAKLDLETTGFDRGIQGAESKTKQLKNTAEQAGTGVNKLATAESQAANAGAKLAMSQERAKKQVKEFNNSLAGLTSGLDGMMNAMNSGSITGMISSMQGLQGTVGNLTGGISGLGVALKSTLLSPVGLAIGAVGALGALFVGSAKAAETFDVAMRELAALTGATGDELQALEDSAIELSNKTGKSAKDIADSFKLIGSQAPQLLQDREGLVAVTDAAITLSKAAKMDVVDAGKAITTAMNGMGIAAEDSGHIIDAMAKAAQLGSYDIQKIAVAMEKSGSIAAGLGISFDEATAAIEQIGRTESSADVAGSQFRSTLIKLSVAENEAFNPAKAGGLKEALDNIAKSGMSTAEMIKLVGESNLKTLQDLIQSRDALAEMDQELQNASGTANEMAEIQKGLSEAVAAVGNAWNNFLIKLGKSEAVQETIQFIKEMCNSLSEWITENDWLIDVLAGVFRMVVKAANAIGTILAKAIEIVKNNINSLISAFQICTNDALSPFEKILGLVQIQIKTVINNIRALLKVIRDVADILFLGDAMDWVMNKFEEAVKYCKGLWEKFLKWLGVSSEKIDINVPKPKSGDKPTSGGSSNKTDKTTPETTTGGGGGGSSTGGKSTKTVKVEPVKGSVSDLENQLSDLKKKYKDGLVNISPEDYKKRVADLEQQIKDKKIEMGIEPKVDKSELQKLEEQLKKLQDNQISGSVTLSADDYKAQVKDLQDKIKQEKIRLGVDLSVDNLDKKLKDITDEAKSKGSSFEIAVKPILEDTEDLSIEDKLKNVEAEMNSNDSLLAQLQELKAAYEELGEAGSEGLAKVNEKIQEVTLNQEGLTEQAKNFAATQKDIKKFDKSLKQTDQVVSTLGSAFGSLGNSLQSLGAGEEAAVGLIIAQSLAELALSFTKALATTATWVDWLAFGISGVATMVSIASQLKGIQGYATGGIIPGSASNHDSVLTMLQPQEMVLNQRQQSHLFEMLNGRSGFGEEVQATPQVEFKIRGQELVGILNNYSTRRGKI